MKPLLQARVCIAGVMLLVSGVTFLQAAGLIGSPMTYSLFEFAKEKVEELVNVTDDQAVHVSSHTIQH